MTHRLLLRCTPLIVVALVAAVLGGCGVGPSVAEPTLAIDTRVVPTETPASPATAPPPAATSTRAPAAAETAGPAAEAESAYLPDSVQLAAQHYAGWQTYENAVYGFALRYPEGWTLSEVTDPGNTMAGHRIDLHQDADPVNRIMVAFRHADEDARILPTGMSQGEIVESGSIMILGDAVDRQALVDRGADSRILYGGTGEVVRGDLVFWLTVDRVMPPDSGRAIPDEVQRTADAILSSLSLSAP